MKKFKILKGGKSKLDKEERLIDSELKQLENFLKLYLLGDTRNKKIIDISCFYGLTLDDLSSIVKRINGIGG